MRRKHNSSRNGSARLAALAAVCILGVVACGSGDDDTSTPAAPQPAATGPATTQDEPTATPAPAGDESEIIEFGFARSGSSYVQAVVVVQANSPALVGEFATVSVNFLNADGRIVATEDQTEVFNWVDQRLVFPFLVGDEGGEIASMDPVVTFSDYRSERAKPPLPVLEAFEITEASYGDDMAVSFELTNETGENMGYRIGVVCYDEAGAVVGGEATYPDAAAGRTVRIDVDVAVSAMPAACRAFPNYGS